MTRDSRNAASVSNCDELTKPQRALLTAIGDGRAVKAHPKPWKRLHALALLDDGALAPLGEAVLWAVKP